MTAKKLIAALAAPVIVSEIIYWGVFTRLFPLKDLYKIIPPVDYAKLTRYSGGGVLAFLVGIAVLFGVYFWLLRQKLPAGTPYFAGIFAGTLFFSYPTMAIDLFVYAIRTRGWALYRLNPLATAPAALPAGDPWLKLAAEWIDAPSPYGPVWELLSVGMSNMVNGDFLAHLFALKAVAIVSYGVSIWLIGDILSVLRPEWKLGGQIAFAWNPLVLLETAQNAHNDMVMVVLLLGTVWAMVRGKDHLSLILLALSVLVKFITVLFAPFLILYLVLKLPTKFHRITATAWYIPVFLIPIFLLMFPLFPGWDNWAVLKAGSGAGRSLLATGVLALEGWLGTNGAFRVTRWVLYGLWLAAMGGTGWRLRRQLNQPTAIVTLGWAALFWYVLIVAPVFHGWYLLWSLPLAALLGGESRAFRATLTFTLTAMLVIPYFETIRVWQPYLLENALLGHIIGVGILILPPLWVYFGKKTYFPKVAN